MEKYNNFGNTKVYTQRGLIPIDEVIPTDYVYEFNTGKLLQVQSTHKHLSDKLFKVIFEDGREQIIDRGDFIYNPHHFTQHVGEHTDKFGNYRIKPPIIACKTFKLVELNSTHQISPYIVGMLSLYGDRKHKYVNIIEKFSTLRTNWAYENNIDFYQGNEITSGCIELTFDGEHKIWDEIGLYNNIPCTLHGYIPNEYFFDTVNHRWQLIRGIFDTGYDLDLFPDNAGIYHSEYNALEEVKELLLSVGVLSRIQPSGTGYRLDVIDLNQHNPNFFYCHDYMTHMINMSAKSPRHFIEAPKIKEIVEIKHGCIHPRTILTELVTCVKNAVYVGEHFLPRISR